MATFSLMTQQSDVRRDGTLRVFIRLTWKRKVAKIPTSYYVSKSQVHPNGEVRDPHIVRQLSYKLDEYDKYKLQLGDKIEQFTAAELRDYLVKVTSVKNNVDLFIFADKELNKLEQANRKGSLKNTSAALNSLEKFVGIRKLNFVDITVAKLKEYEQWLRTSGVGARGIQLYMGHIRTLFNQARDEYNDEDMGSILIPNYPFKKYVIPKPPITRKRALPVEKLQAIAKHEPKTALEELARDMFMLSFYLVGMNSADLYACPPPVKGRITYHRAKTTDRRQDKAELSVKVEPEALPLLKKYKGDVRLLNVSVRYSSPGEFNRAINKGLKRVGSAIGEEGLQFYAARHSWATIATNDCKINDITVAKCLNHQVPELRTTSIYQKRDWGFIDAANRKVLDFLEPNVS